MQYPVAILLALSGLGCIFGADNLIGAYVGLSLLTGALLYTLPAYFISGWLHLMPVREEDTVVDEWGELWACLRRGALYAAILIAGNYIYERYIPSPPYDIFVTDKSKITEEEAIEQFRQRKAPEQPAPDMKQ